MVGEGGNKKKRVCLGGETEDRRVRTEEQEWTIMKRSAEGRGRAPGSRLESKSSNCFDLEPSRAELRRNPVEGSDGFHSVRVKSQAPGSLLKGQDQTVPVRACFGWEGNITVVPGRGSTEGEGWG